MFAIIGMPTVSDPGVHDPTAIVVQKSSASISAIASQSRAAKYAQKRSATRVAAFSSRGACGVQFLKPRERGVEVCLVEDFARG